MANISQMIRSVARTKRVEQYIVEKDYGLSYLLAAIFQVDGLGENLVLKGGTALRKAYFADYRFSEDLDFSTRVMGPIQPIDDLMQEVIQQMRGMLTERGPFLIELEKLVLKYPHPGEQIAYLVRVQFPEQRQPLCRLKVEITVDEPILSPVNVRAVLHGFPEEMNVHVPVYSLAEITAEKLRALLQSKARYHERGWGASRVCRDYYDLWNLLQIPEIKSTPIIPLLLEKCSVRHVAFQTPADFISEDLMAVARREWGQQLSPFVPNVVLAEELLPQVQAFILSIWD